jgi:TatD DNase family protein
MGWFDVHAHLTHPRMVADRQAILQRAREAGVTTIISNGLNPADNEAVLQLARETPMVRPAFGLYPVDAVMEQMIAHDVEYPRDSDETWTAEESIGWVADHIDQAFAVGEIGLDHYWVPEPLWEAQEDAFRQLVQLAMDADKPIIIHSRKAERRTFEVLKEMGTTRVNWHCYSSKVKLGRQIAAHGHYLSIPANVRKAQNFIRLLETVPRDRILLETDCPFLAPVRGERNEPAHVASTAQFAAETWAVDIDEVQAQLADNFTTLFGCPP